MSDENILRLRRLPSRDELFGKEGVDQPVVLKPKDQKYLAELEADNAFLSQQVEKYKINFDWSVLWQDDIAPKTSMWTIVIVVLQFVAIIMIFVFKK